jgi:hypothetical protein
MELAAGFGVLARPVHVVQGVVGCKKHNKIKKVTKQEQQLRSMDYGSTELRQCVLARVLLAT